MLPSAEAAAAHDSNFIAAIRLLAELAPHGSVREIGPLTVAVTGVPDPFFNATWVLESPVPDELDEAVDHLRSTGLPFTVHVRNDLIDASVIAGRLGLTDAGRLPCFALEARAAPPVPNGLQIQRVGTDEWEAFAAATAAGFGMTRAVIEGLLRPGMLELPQVRAFMGTVDGRAVSTSAAVRTGDTLGIYNVATVPSARGHGYGTALTWHPIRDADPGWRVAVLQASAMGRPIYERMGFTLVREFTTLVAQPAAETSPTD